MLESSPQQEDHHASKPVFGGADQREVGNVSRYRPLLEFVPIYGMLGLRRKEAPAMGTLRFADLQTRSTEVLDLTSLTLDEFRLLVPPFEAAFQAYMASWRLDGKPRTVRR